MKASLIIVIDAIFRILYILVIAKIVLSWGQVLGLQGPIVDQINEIIDSIIEPILRPLRKIVPVVQIGGMGLDLSILVLILLLPFVQSLVIGLVAVLIP